MSALRLAGALLGMVLLLGTLGSVISTTVVPRGTRSRTASLTARGLNLPFSAVANRIDDWRRRDHLRAYEGPTFVIALLVVWLLLLLLAYALLLWPWTGDAGTALRSAGAAIFTLGAAGPEGAAPTAVIFCAAATGLIVIALQIGYLPALYAAFNRRETLVTVLTGAGGSPAWGPEILARAHVSDGVGLLARLYERWTDWAGDIAESHQAYPALLYFRSPSSDRSWVVSLLAVMDAAALHLALLPLTAPPEARQLQNSGQLAFRDLTARISLDVDPCPARERTLELLRDDFDLAVERLRSVGVEPERSLDDAWRHFAGWRKNYESEAYALARAVDAVPAVWSGPRVHAGRQVMPETADRVAPPDEHTQREIAALQRTTELRKQARDDAAE